MSTTSRITSTFFLCAVLYFASALIAQAGHPSRNVPVSSSNVSQSEYTAGTASHIQAVARLMEAGLYVSPAVPELLGFKGPRTYLLLIQNNHELRATGGFISAIGQVTIEQGVLGEIEIQDSYRIIDHSLDHPAAPQAMQRYMGIGLMFVRDANWSPDFPTTASLVRALYTQDTGTPVDGVIAIDLHAMRRLVHALGPMEVEGADAPVTGDNFVEQIIQFWESPLESDHSLATFDGTGSWWRQRKDFMPLLAEAALNRLRSGHVNPFALAHATVASLDSGSIQIWMADPAVTRTLIDFGWAGYVGAQPGVDYLAPVDSNMGYNKVDAVLERSLDYAVTWEDGKKGEEGEEDRAIATATLSYRHPTPISEPLCDPDPHYGLSYSEMTLRCYFNFLRLYVPRGSELLSMEGVEPDSIALQPQTGPNQTTVFGGYFVMEPGTTHQVRIVYALPNAITPDAYALTIRRQAGAGPLPVNLQIGEHTLNTRLEKTQLTWSPGR